MKFRNQQLKYGRRFAPIYSMAEGEGDGAGGGGGGGDGAALTQADIDAAVEAAVGGLKSKNSELLESLTQTKKTLKDWDGLDPTEVRDMMDRLSKDEELKLLSEGKHEEAWSKRLEKVGAKHQSEIDGLTADRDSATAERDRLAEQVRDLVIDQKVLSAFMGEKGLESAAPDVVLRAKAAFKIEDGTPIARDENGEIIRGADGAITVEEWVGSLKQSAPHLFPGSQGAGAGGAGGAAGGGDVEARLAAASESGNMAEYRRLRAERDQKTG